ncbi:hypothetical protein B0H10DRAFT_2192200 [Mycena sp. CBHHK59/15]|nr:hypothetical protein B0H10DRAFT_2192200 [Mycena sp. CBHHK59/15]
MVRTFTFFIAALVASSVYAAPLDARRKGSKKASATLAATTTATATGVSAIDASIEATALSASATAAAAQQSAIDSNTTPGEAFIDPSFEGEEAFLDTKIGLEFDAGEDAEAQADEDTFTELNQSAGGASEWWLRNYEVLPASESRILRSEGCQAEESEEVKYECGKRKFGWRMKRCWSQLRESESTKKDRVLRQARLAADERVFRLEKARTNGQEEV